MNILIIEDEAPAARRLTKLVEQIKPKAEFVGVIESVKDGLHWFETNPLPDLIISDIQLSDNLSFELLKQVSTKVPLIFTTAYDQYAIQAFEHLSIDYLLKPIRKEQLEKAFEKLNQFGQAQPQVPIDEILQLMKHQKFRERFLVYSGENLISVPASDVAYFYTEDGATFLMHQSGKNYFLTESLDKIEQCIDTQRFYRANRQFLLSIDCIKSAVPYFNQKLMVTIKPPTKHEVIISKLKSTGFKNWMNV